MVEPSLTITVEAVGLGEVVMSANPGVTDLGVSGYAEPAMQARVVYASDESIFHGSQMRGSSLQQTMLTFSVFPTSATTEQEARDLIAALVDIVTMPPSGRVLVTVEVSDAAPEVWSCDPGTVAPVGARTLTNLRHVKPEWDVSLPAYPIRSVT